jgi:hypothetical protein
VVGERNHQVKMMSDIYRQATYVYVWLGPSDADTEAAMRVLKTGLRRFYKQRTDLATASQRKRRRGIQVNQPSNSGDETST